MESDAKNVVAENGGADLANDRQAVPPAIADRNQWLEVMADVQLEMERRFAGVNRRLARVESRRGGIFGEMPEEVRGLLVMLTLYVGISYVLPMIGELVQKWRSQHS